MKTHKLCILETDCHASLRTGVAMTGFFDSLEEPPGAVLFCVHHFSGRVTVTVVPSPSRLVRDTVPWW